MQPIISVSGLRGIIGESLTPDIAARYVAAFASTLPIGPIVVSRDGRSTGQMLAAAISSALEATGHQVLNAGVAATPTTGILVREHKAVGGIQISASHNPPEYNGIKLFSAEGRVIPAKPGQTVLERYQSGDIAWSKYNEIGSVARIEDTTSHHLALVLARVDVAAIRARRFRVLLDSNHGAGNLLGKPLLESLGCEMQVVGGEPNGLFAHPPEPTADNLREVAAKIREAKCDIGFCQDPDADRLAVIDENGRYVGEEYTLALCLDQVLRQSPGRVVINCATSRMNQDIAERQGSVLTRSAVGEANVVDEMIVSQAVFGGEGNGGPIDPQVGYVRDSFVGMSQILAAMASRGLPVSKLVDDLPRYEIFKDKVTLPPDRIASSLARLPAAFADANASLLDGVRLDWPDRWLIVRASNTEPIVRTIAEAKSLSAAKDLCAQAARILSQS